MGIFEKNKSKTVNQRLDEILDVVKKRGTDLDSGRLEHAVNQIKNRPDTLIIKPLELCVDILELILNNPHITLQKQFPALTDAEKIYIDIFKYDEETPEFDKLRLIFIEMFQPKNVYEYGMYDLKLFNSFSDKEKYISLFQALVSVPNAQRVFLAIKDYGVVVREYMIDDDTYLGHLVKVISKICKATDDDTQNAILKEEMENIQRMNGVYNVDPVRIAQVEQNVREAGQIISSATELLKAVDVKTAQMNKMTEEFFQKSEEMRRREEVAIEAKLSAAKTTLDDIINEYADNQKKVIVVEKDLLLKQVFADAESELNKYKALAKTVVASTSMEIANLNKNAESVINRVSNFVNNDAEVRKVLEKAEIDQALMDKINKLTILNDKNIDAISKQMEIAAGNAGGEPAPQPVQSVKADAAVSGSAASVQAGRAVVQIGGTVEEDLEPIPTINPLLDPAIPFKERFELVMKEKERRKAAGEHFHEMFDDVLVAVMEDANPYMIGPSGCGKTFMVKQIASLLNMEFIDIGYINEEYDILGFQTATGAYSRPNFYRCYKYGIIAFCDELDNGNSRAAVKLNSFLSNNLDACYSFPNGENVHRHPNFRVIAAGNTEGNGADANYNTREKIEESVQQRFVPMHVGYDNYVEQAILGKYKNWFDFVVMFRAATDKWASVNGIAAQGILTTRDTSRIKRYLDNGSFSMEKIIRYEFIQTKEDDYLAFIAEKMGELAPSYPDAKPMYTAFCNMVNEKRQSSMRR